ncbi:hypothetical protein [Rickettsia canadensis]|nr:hypothetical protein [Rickettsia canadensis]AFB21296.1 hypothetical protein RCA_03685 [Rickettsia canadensis str. CA410]
MKEDTEIEDKDLEDNIDYENICESIKSTAKAQWITNNDSGHPK